MNLALMASLALLAGSLGSAAQAGTPYTETVVCPVDGRSFTYTATASYSTFGRALDGKPHASWIMPLPLPQCPDSRFPVYRTDFSADEQARIRALVETPEYKAIKDEASYYVLWFVLGRMGEEGEGVDALWPLVKATWQVSDDPERYAHYVGQLTPLMDAALEPLRASQPADWWYLQLVLANLARQSGDFEGATARLVALDGIPPDVGDLVQRLDMTRGLIASRDRSLATPRD